MKSVIKQDSYWFIDGEGDDAKMKALCTICSKKSGTGWFWSGSLGYGDYDLFCDNCKNAIHLREKDEIKATNQESRE